MRVKVYCLEGRAVREFPDIRTAAREMAACYDSIKKSMRTGEPVDGLQWFSEKPEPLKRKETPC